MSIHDDILLAERQIGAILRDLELTHPSYAIMGISLRTIEVTRIQDDRERFAQRVVIELRPNPRNEWSV